MLRSAFTLVRTSLPTVLMLTVSLVVLSNLLSGEADDTGADKRDALPSLAPLAKPAVGNAGTAVLQSAMFDPAHRPETIAGSIDDLRAQASTAPAAPVTIAGVLLSGPTRKAMLSLGSAAPAWSAVGADVGGWRVAAIDTTGATIERDGRSLALKVADRFKTGSQPQHAPGAGMPNGAEPQPPDMPNPMMPPMPNPAMPPMP